MQIILASQQVAHRTSLTEQERIFIHFLVQNLNKYNMLNNKEHNKINISGTRYMNIQGSFFIL
jgi:hypothetical protein